jgi:hypothetical protein
MPNPRAKAECPLASIAGKTYYGWQENSVDGTFSSNNNGRKCWMLTVGGGVWASKQNGGGGSCHSGGFQSQLKVGGKPMQFGSRVYPNGSSLNCNIRALKAMGSRGRVTVVRVMQDPSQKKAIAFGLGGHGNGNTPGCTFTLTITVPRC